MLIRPAWPSALYEHFTASVHCRVQLGGKHQKRKTTKKVQLHPNFRDT